MYIGELTAAINISSSHLLMVFKIATGNIYTLAKLKVKEKKSKIRSYEKGVFRAIFGRSKAFLEGI